jgi:hypothetical protein
MENRFFFEGHEDPFLLNHFKRYHLLMFFLFVSISYDPNLLVWLFSLLLMPLVQDITWQIIEKRKLQQDDWSNIGGFPLVGGLYLWYWIDSVVLFLLLLLLVRNGLVI